MPLSAAQSRQLAIVPAGKKTALRKSYNEQNSGGPPKGSKQRGRNQMANFRNMPAPSNARSMPDMNKGNWSQTPASSNYLAPRGFGYYDAFAHDPYSVATHMSIGPATPIVGSTIASSLIQTGDYNVLDNGVEGGSIIVIVYPSTSDVQARLYQCSSSTSTDTCYYNNFSSPQLNSESPLDAIPTRCSVRIRNWTQAVAQGGVVRTLRMTSGVALSGVQGGGAADSGLTSNAELAEFMDGVRNHARTRSYGGEELATSMQKNCSVVDQSRALWFDDWNEQKPVKDVPWAKALGWEGSTVLATFTQQLYQPAYTPIVFLFEPFIATYGAGTSSLGGNRYELTVRSQFLAHYPQGTMLANMAIDPRANPSEMISHRNHEETKGSVLEKIVSTLGHGGQWAWGHRNEIAQLAKPLFQIARRGAPALAMV